MKKVIQDSLQRLFEELADAYNDESRLPRGLKRAYEEEMKKPHMREFFTRLNEQNIEKWKRNGWL